MPDQLIFSYFEASASNASMSNDRCDLLHLDARRQIQFTLANAADERGGGLGGVEQMGLLRHGRGLNN